MNPFVHWIRRLRAQLAELAARCVAWARPGRVDALLIAVGLAIRLRQYFANHSLEVSEAELALNLIGRSFLEFLRPLDLDQAAPILFLWIERLAIMLFGSGELARLPSTNSVPSRPSVGRSTAAAPRSCSVRRTA